MAHTISDSERHARLRLIRSAGIGPLTYGQLLTRKGSAEAAIEALPELTAAAKRRPFQLASIDAVNREIDQGEDLGLQLITLGEPDYPVTLSAIPDPPPTLWALGEARWLHEPSVAIVGARNASAAGRQLTDSLARALGAEGLTIVSGMARGIDGVAHRASLETGTIAVLAGGVNNIYPPAHADLHALIAEQGVVISEQPLGMTARAKDFPKRNRIVSGLSRGVLVVEAAERSGTLITARLASEQGRDVFAVPGSPLDPRSAGTNRLIKGGAILVQDAGDILAELEAAASMLREGGQSELFSSDEEDERPDNCTEQVLALLSHTPTHTDQIITLSHLPARLVVSALVDLVLDGRALEEAGGTYVLSPSDMT